MKKLVALLLAMLMLASILPLTALAADELPTLKVLGTWNGHDPNNDPTAKAIEEKTGYHVEYYMLPAENAVDNLLMQIGSGDRSERIRTYNFPQGRVTDHRIGLTLYRIEDIMEGDLDELISALTLADQEARMAKEL